PEGVRLVAGYICADCLIQISCTDVEDPKYAFYVAKLKELWQAG
ncbi:MAG TPA: inhibitor of sigma-G Gin, partial [Firmicutes bacterium]|nr:inhibitor of sigma-G Gin [Bacillota bacterium]